MRPSRRGAARAEVISIGRELLRGQVADVNGRALARELSERGCIVRRMTVIDDSERSIASVLREALGREPHLVVTSGGLGPGENDRTLSAVADVLGRPLSHHPQAKLLVEEAYRRLERERAVPSVGLNAARDKLCHLPVGGEAIANPLGVSPGVLSRLAGGCQILCLPGRPAEAEAVLGQALPRLGSLASSRRVAQREVEAPTSDESELVPLLERLAIEYPAVRIDSCPPGTAGAGIVILVEATGADEREANAAADGVVRRLLALAAGGT